LLGDDAKGQTLSISNDLGLPEKSINVEHLRRIMAARIEEMFQLIAAELEAAEVLGEVREGIFICGGGARIPQIQRAASAVFGVPAYLGKTTLIGGIKSALDQPEFATAIGLARFGSFELKKRGDDRRPLLGIRSTLSQLLKPLTRG
jgi:cell division protein FtsA